MVVRDTYAELGDLLEVLAEGGLCQTQHAADLIAAWRGGHTVVLHLLREAAMGSVGSDDFTQCLLALALLRDYLRLALDFILSVDEVPRAPGVGSGTHALLSAGCVATMQAKSALRRLS